jgi:hypothetical protein
MRQLKVLLIVGGLIGGLLVAVTAPSASADPPTCGLRDANGVCVITVQDPGSGGGTTPGSGGTAPVGAPTCTSSDYGQEVPCDGGGLGYWSQGNQCYISSVSPQPPVTDPVWQGNTTGAIYNCTFYVPPGGTFPGTAGGWFWSPTVPARAGAVDPAAVAQQALTTLRIPAPTVGRYPAGRLQDGRPYTVVRAYTWYYTERAGFTVLHARAAAGGVSAQVTVTPTQLSFTPGDGARAVSCAGPGVAWQHSDGPWAASPAGCDYRYPHSSIGQPNGEVTATYGITWAITWSASTGASGTLPPLTTTTNSTFAVAEAEAVVTK